MDWHEIFKGYGATVDWPSTAYWREISEAFPEAVIVLSTRDPDKWWKSASETIFPSILRNDQEENMARRLMTRATLARTFHGDLTDREGCIAAFNRHNEEVRRTAPHNRLVEWNPKDGWEPLCKALKLPIPSMPFPESNSKEEFVTKLGLQQSK
jgi:hypothetical protein